MPKKIATSYCFRYRSKSILLNFNCMKTHQLVNNVHSTQPHRSMDARPFSAAVECVFMSAFAHALSIIVQMIRNFFILASFIYSEWALYHFDLNLSTTIGFIIVTTMHYSWFVATQQWSKRERKKRKEEKKNQNRSDITKRNLWITPDRH